ncbi:hypothetical protein M8C21_019786 [Ambrosia artemisiifolia]|uniref:mRNA guanylyltransferase n=1 Tax=Ambrosia artemisiifolia TaxID=4212 RepID=A0AAD5GUH3_AMBAR|nr:hypothetical protein M8C21_019786 [Ambrosia artemisiifolia]
MDLNASPEREEDEETFEPSFSEDSAPEVIHSHHHHVEHVESAVDILRREREERKQRLKRERPDDRPTHPGRQSMNDHLFHTKIQRTYDKSRLPPGWLDCPAYGQEIGCIVPSKVPLGESFNDCIVPDKSFTNKEFWGGSRYYSVNDCKKEGIKYVKINCKGRGSVPENEAVNQFVYEASHLSLLSVSQFLERQKNTKKYILVHCTHGHNRTGYMIIHFLMRTSPMSVTQAIRIFSEARPPGIYKPDYIDALYTFYHEVKPDIVTCPSTPEWKRSSEFDLNGEALPDEDDDGVQVDPLDENHHDTVGVMTNDDVLGDSIPQDQQDRFRQFCYQALKLNAGVRGNHQFPGSHPVSLDSENLQLLRQRYYYATWKADGTRYMMLITMDGCYLIDRNFVFRRGLAEKVHHFTLLDGEMIIDTLPDTGKQERRYLIYDLMAINQISIVERPFYERWKMLEKEVVEPRNLERHNKRNYFYIYDTEPFRVRRKAFWLLSTVTKLLKEFIPMLSHDADGLVFQGWDDPYVPRTHEGLLKWKYASMNSVDFLFEMAEDRQLLFLFERGKKKLMEGNKIAFGDDIDPASYLGKIVECAWNSEEDVWVCMRVRTDKATPNEFNTYRKVMRSIKDNITEEVLLDEIDEIIRLPMYADRINQDRKGRHHSSSRPK